MAYEHILVSYDGTSEGDAALLTASKLAARDGARLTIVTVVALERTVRGVRRLPMLTSVWNDVLLDRARADLERAERLLDMSAERTVLFGSQTKALAAGAEEFGCDAIMLPAPRFPRLAKLLHLDRSRGLQRRAGVAVLRPRWRSRTLARVAEDVRFEVPRDFMPAVAADVVAHLNLPDPVRWTLGLRTRFYSPVCWRIATVRRAVAVRERTRGPEEAWEPFPSNSFGGNRAGSKRDDR